MTTATSTPGGINPQPRTPLDNMRNWQRLAIYLASGVMTIDANGSLIINSAAPIASVGGFLVLQLASNGGLIVDGDHLSINPDESTLTLDSNVLLVKDGGITLEKLDVLAAKGDLLTFSTIQAILGVGADGTVLTADSGEATGLKWDVPSGGGGGSGGLTFLTFTDPGGGGGGGIPILISKSAWSATTTGTNFGGANSDAFDSSYAASLILSCLGGEQFVVDMGVSHSLSRIVINCQKNFGPGNEYPSNGYTLEISPDNSTWTTITTTAPGSSGAVGSLEPSDNSFTAAPCRYVRITINVGGSPTGRWFLNELDFYGPSPGAAQFAASETVAGSAGKVVRVRFSGLKAVSTNDLGFQVGTGSGDYYGFLWTGTDFKIQKAISSTVTDIAGPITVSSDTNVHVFELLIFTPASGSISWIMASMDGVEVTAIDSSVSLTSGTLNFYFLTDVPSTSQRGAGYHFGNTIE